MSMHSALTNASDIKIYHMLTQKHALKLEMKGIRHSKGSVYAHIKRTYGLRGNKELVYTQFCELIEKEKGNA